jgi:predicted transcriptional regulator
MAKTEPTSLFDIEPDVVLESRLDAEAEACYATARVVAHDKVVAWLESWGADNELPPPTP